MTRNGTHEEPEEFLDENDVKIGMGFEDHFDDEIIFSDIL